MSKIKNLYQKKKELLEKIELAEKNKKEVNNFVQKILARYRISEISYTQYNEIIEKRFGEKTPQHWIDYYDFYISAYKSQINSLNNQIKTKKLLFIAIPAVFALLLLAFFIFSSSQIKSGITGLTVQEPDAELPQQAEEPIEETVPEPKIPEPEKPKEQIEKPEEPKKEEKIPDKIPQEEIEESNKTEKENKSSEQINITLPETPQEPEKNTTQENITQKIQKTPEVPEEPPKEKPILIKEIQNIEIVKNTQKEIALNEYFSYSDFFFLLQAKNLTSTNFDHTIKIIPDKEFLGTRTVKIIASNSLGTAESNFFNITISESTALPVLIRQIPDIEIPKNSETIIHLEEYFSNSEQFFILQVKNISTTTFDHTINIKPDKDFTGERTSKIIASNQYGTAESNFFNIAVGLGELKENITDLSNVSNISINTIQYKAVINKPVKWVKTINLENISGDIKIQLPKDAENISIKTGREIQETLSQLEEYEEIIEKLDRGELTAGALTGNVVFDIRAREDFIPKIFRWFKGFTITGNVILEGQLQNEITETNEGKIINVGEIALQTQETQIAIEYYTPGPISQEETNKRGKRVVISGGNITDILAFTEIPEIISTGQESRIKIFWKEQNEYINFTAQDTDNNGLLDYIEWLVPHLSNQTFEIILITKAEHLDKNKQFISDIYEQVKELDENWSEEIKSNEYVRVTFEQKLTSDRDITLYPRIISGNPRIEVYEFNKTELIAEFSSLADNEYNKVFLDGSSGSGLANSSDTFDLLVKGGSIELDHIIDPNITVTKNPAVDIALASLDNRTFVVAWVDDIEDDVTFMVYDTNGTNLTMPIDLTTAASAVSSVSVAPINTTSFVVFWYESVAADVTYSVITKKASNYTINVAATDILIAAGTSAAVAVTTLNNRFHACYEEAGTADATVSSVIYNTWGAGTITDINGAVGTAANLQNLVDCSAINSTRNVFVFFDDINNDATFSLLTQAGTEQVTDTDLDLNVGETGQVATTGINRSYFALAWYNGVSGNITGQVRTVNNDIISTFLVDLNASRKTEDPRIAMTAVKNSTDPEDWFIIAWNDRNASNINASLYNATGTLQRNFVLATDENETSFLFDIYGKEGLENVTTPGVEKVISGCPDTFLFAYTNNSASSGVTIRPYNIDGTLWDGVCGAAAPPDTTPPSVTINFPTNTTYNKTALLLNFNVTLNENGSVLYSLDKGVNNVTMLSSQDQTSKVGLVFNWTNSSIADGTYSFNIYANDTLGNNNYTHFTSFKIDATTPLISFVSTTAEHYANITDTSINVTISVTETNRATTKFYLYNGTGSILNISNFTTAINNLNFTGLNVGNYTYNVSVNDTAGNINSTGIRHVNLTAPPNTAPQITFVSINKTAEFSPVEDSTRKIYVNFTVSDSNGVSEIDNKSAQITFNLSAETIRKNTTCAPFSTINDANSLNFSCSIDMWYYDAPGSWQVNVTINDSSNAIGVNITTNFTFTELTAMKMYPNALTWPANIALTAENTKSNNDPIRVNNTGNDNTNNIAVTGINLHGESTTGQFIPAANFTVDETDACDAGPAMINNSAVTITGASLTKGNNSVNDGSTGQEDVYFCLEGLNLSISSQSYSTALSSSWTVSITSILALLLRHSEIVLSLALIIRRKKKKAEKALEIFNRELKRRKIDIQTLLEIDDKLKVSGTSLQELLTLSKEKKKQIEVPVSIFAREIAPAESLVKYMKENLGMNYNEIAKLLNRNPRTIWINYRNAIGKMPKKIRADKKVLTNIEVFADRKLSILESVIIYLRKQGLKNSEIAKILNKDPRNIWTLYSRAVRKLESNI